MTTTTLSAATAPTRPGKALRSENQNRPAWLFIAPFAVFYLAFLIGPAVYMFIASFFDTSLVKPGLGSFAGFANYAEMLGNATFWSAMWHTLQFTIYTTIPLVVLSFVFAVLANRMSRGAWFWRLSFFAPYILPSASVALIWIFVFSSGTGLWPTIQTWFGAEAPNPVLGSPSPAMVGIAITTIWWTIGFNFILYLAGLQEVPRELYEAAALDGATAWQQIRFLTIPMLRRTTTLVILLQIIASLKIFDQVAIMTDGGPGTSTEVALTFISHNGFNDNRIGAAAAASVLLFIVIVVIAVARQLIERAQERRAA